mmetsp:Transcript_14140/g.39089  ORF Transcript_14140/g.39089 Transcript_14140/m.39089 type:complete len:517 (+) Transcript_14140:54-1604(+)
MGNAQCLAEPGAGVKDGDVLFVGPSPNSKVYDFDNPDLKGDFLKLHLQERPEKCIVDPRLVVQCLVKQAEELVQRELEAEKPLDHELDEPYDINKTGSTRSSSDSSATSQAFASSVVMSLASSGMTTVSAATPVVGNYNRYARRKRPQVSTPPKVLGNRVDLDDTLHEDLYKVIEAVTRVEENRRMHQSVTQPVHARLRGAGCIVIPQLTTARDPRPMVSLQAKLHLITLHLRIIPKCAAYFKSHMLRFFPHHPFSLAVSNGISSSDLSPNRHRQRGSASFRHEDFTPKSIDIGYGEGPPSKPIQLLVNGSTFLDLGLTGSLGMVEQPKQRIESNKLPKPPEHYVVLLNRRSGAPLAVCALKNTSIGNPVVRIYATKRRSYGQRPAASTRKLGFEWTDSFPLYAWAEIATEGRYPDRVQYSIFMASGNDGRFEQVPSYLAEHSSVGSPEIRVLGMTDREVEYTGCAVLSLSTEEDSVDGDLFFRLSVSKGVDPALLICFAAFVDEFMEKTMRYECA